MKRLLMCLMTVGIIAGSLVTSAGADGESWSAQYYANTTLNGQPVLTRLDAAIDFDWGTGSPDPAVPADNFSVRWERDAWFDEGTYRFYARSDDGFRLWVDGLLVIDSWMDQQGAWITRDYYLPQGTHSLRAEYYEHGGGAQVLLAWDRVLGGYGWLGEYYANQELNGPAILTRNDPAIDFTWGYAAPDGVVPEDHFSVRWSRTIGFSAGIYRFLTSTDDGVRLWVDDQLLVEFWGNQQLPNTHWGEIDLSEGQHQIRVEYFENGGEAHAHVWWEKRSASITAWKGEYFDNPHLVGGPALVRDDASIDFDWGTGPPVTWMPDDNFGVRWTRSLAFQPGYYRLSVRSDDGVQVWLDGGLVIDKWHPMEAELHYVDGIYLSGVHDLRIDYYEGNGQAKVQFWISDASSPGEPVTPTPGNLTQGPWQGAYYDNVALQGAPALVRQDAAIDFDWRFDAPHPSLPAEHFGVRWTTALPFPAGRYQFTTHTDDGVRLYIDGWLAIDSWQPMRGHRYITLDLPAGSHSLVVEYYERTEAALARVSWAWLGDPQGSHFPE